MPTDLPQEEFEVLWDDGEFILSRINNQHDRSPALLVRPAAAYATAVSRARLKHAYALRDELEDSWARQDRRTVSELLLRIAKTDALARANGGMGATASSATKPATLGKVGGGEPSCGPRFDRTYTTSHG
jgi:hypothetical protein